MRSVRASRPRSIDSSSRTSAHSAKTVTARAVTHSPMTAAATMARSIDSSILMRRLRRSSAASTRSGQQPTASTTAPTAPTAQPGVPVASATQAPSAARPTTAMRTTSAHSIRSRIPSPVRAPEGVAVLESSSESSTGSAGVEADGAEAGGDTWAAGGRAVIQGLLAGVWERLPGAGRGVPLRNLPIIHGPRQCMRGLVTRKDAAAGPEEEMGPAAASGRLGAQAAPASAA